MKSVALVVNGLLHDPLVEAALCKEHDLLIAVDGGLSHCEAMQLTPDLIVGDFDSAPEELLEKYPGVEKKAYPLEKDQTDLELALELAFAWDPTHITLIAALGGRPDMQLHHLHLLCRYPGKLRIETPQETLFALDGSIQLTTEPNQRLSLLPLNGPATGVTTRGLAWELTDATLNQDFISISNRCLGEKASLSVQSGTLICYLHHV